ncbi:thioredoxin domain-containing protein [Desulforegula conservatrix]|uniref:thioredoxin domain-containing protein n=1 Tax=Desulforegula conservatrix TaxID=153026 RepID=UPI000419177E|nr:thioredoxin domain-containing protein [Desulforegula conservatrix]
MKANRLINQKSPYLQQHATNPVDWYPWGEEAFNKARGENKPVFLSIGYSACHWCHVMEHESFDDEATSEILNKVFVCIKVDREEHPAVDEMFMTACNMISGSGGWPLSIFLTPDMLPFFAATYIPRESAFGRTGLKEIAGRVHNLWSTNRKAVLESAYSVREALANFYRIYQRDPLSPEDFFQADKKFKSRYDRENGGFMPHPKFPMPHTLIYLMRRSRLTGENELLEMATNTLRKMRFGGIWDHVGLGFHRYSTDTKWFLPHFEKMLYDQALSACAYLEAYDITKDRFFLKTACEILDYVLTDLTSPDGGFYSAQDADSEGEEGLFYTWEYKELEKILDDKDLIFLETWFGVSARGNYKDEATGKNAGRNILAISSSENESEVFLPGFDSIRKILYEARQKRTMPLLDKKILVSWNGLAIMAFALGFRHTGNQVYIDAAEKAAGFIKNSMRACDGRLFRGGMEIYDLIPPVSQDYSHLITGLLHLADVSEKNEYVKWASELQEIMIADFFDSDSGVFRMADKKGVLCVNPFDMNDSAIPSSNSAAFYNLRVLSDKVGRPDWKKISERLEKNIAGSAIKWPDGFSWFFACHESLTKS